MVWHTSVTTLIITKMAKVMILTNNQQALENSYETFVNIFTMNALLTF